MTLKQWYGKGIIVSYRRERTRLPIGILLKEETARNLTLALAKIKQTTLMLPEDVEEIHTALNYVLVGDPASTAAHRRMEASKGMEPAMSDPPAVILPRPLRDTEERTDQADPPTDPGMRIMRRRETTSAGERLGSRDRRYTDGQS